MKLMKLHSKTVTTVYRNSLCSVASLIVFFATITSILIPILLVTLLSPYSGISEVRVLYEQPNIKFKYNYIFYGENLIDNSFLACSTFPYLNKIGEANSNICNSAKYWKEDYNHDGKNDKGYFELKLNLNEDTRLGKIYLILFFQGMLQHKCPLEPPAILIQEINVPENILPNGEIVINGCLKLIQHHQFICPYYGRKIKSHFQNEILSHNSSKTELFMIENIRKKIKLNPAYFEIKTNDIYYKKNKGHGLVIKLNLDIFEVHARYRLSIWERLGQFWLYFASFFGISFYICNFGKDFLFSRHILKSWEVMPWKKWS